jgi:hypothetical protein
MLQGRTIPELDPKLQNRMGMETVTDAAVGDKNKRHTKKCKRVYRFTRL